MELSSSKLEKQIFLILSEKQKSLAHFWPHALKSKKPALKKFLIFPKKSQRALLQIKL